MTHSLSVPESCFYCPYLYYYHWTEDINISIFFLPLCSWRQDTHGSGILSRNGNSREECALKIVLKEHSSLENKTEQKYLFSLHFFWFLKMAIKPHCLLCTDTDVGPHCRISLLMRDGLSPQRELAFESSVYCPSPRNLENKNIQPISL